MTNSESFLQTFVEIEKWLRQHEPTDRSASFYELVEKVAGSNGGVRRYKVDLKEFADLRNAIVHERTDGHVIAEPNQRAVADLERIRVALLQPPVVLPQFQKPVVSRTSSESVGQAVSDMRTGSFSQLPIMNESRVVGLLTAETIVRWLAAESTNDLVSLSDTRIEEVLPHMESPDHYAFLGRRSTLLQALELFETFASRGRDLDAILLSQDGKSDQRLLGIITVYDLPTILQTLGLRRVAAA